MRAPLAAVAAVAVLWAPRPPLLRAAPADPWAEVVAEAASRDEAVAALGTPLIEFTAFVKKGAMPVQLSPSLPPPPAPREAPDFADDDLLRVLEYPGKKRGLAYQVVLKEERVWYAIAPPLEDEATADALRKKFGKATIESVDVLTADLLRTWELIRYEKRKRTFIRKPGERTILARVIVP